MALSQERANELWLERWPTWVERATEKHKSKYMYPDLVRVDGKIRIICPEHGEFWQAPNKHMFGQGCAKCAGHTIAPIDKLKTKFPAFDFKDANPKTTKSVTTFTCPEHGDFETTPGRLLNLPEDGIPCPICAKKAGGRKARVTDEEWHQRIDKVWNGKIKYKHRVETRNSYAIFTCQEHGDFEAAFVDVEAGKACSECGREKRYTSVRLANQLTLQEVADRFFKVHGTTYTYDWSTYDGWVVPMRMYCKTHGEFWQRPDNHFNNQSECPKCANGNTSRPEQRLQDFVKSLVPGTLTNTRQIIPPLELDIYLPDHKLAIEFCGLYWHGSNYKEKTYHQDKYRMCQEKGIKLLTVFEDEWYETPLKVEAQIRKYINGVETIGARKTRLEVITWQEVADFLETYHLAGKGKATNYCLALKAGDLIVSVTTWGVDRFSKVPGLELYRMATVDGISVSGGFSRMLDRVRKDFPDVQRFVTYADMRWGDGGVYGQAGFTRIGETAPGYFWCKGWKRMSRHKFQKHKLKEIFSDYDENKTEIEMCESHGMWRIYDCGHVKWELLCQK